MLDNELSVTASISAATSSTAHVIVVGSHDRKSPVTLSHTHNCPSIGSKVRAGDSVRVLSGEEVRVRGVGVGFRRLSW